MSMWNSAKAKVQLRYHSLPLFFAQSKCLYYFVGRLSVQRLRTLQQKKEAQAKTARRDIALLVERGKIETARIKVESIINEDIYVELLEVMELYCELLLARFGLLDQNTREPDPGIIEGVCAVIHAAQRTELKELHILRDILMHKYGREFSIAVMENRDGCVSKRVTSKLMVDTPAPALVDAYIKEITKAYGVPFSLPGEALEENVETAKEETKETTGETAPINVDTPNEATDAKSSTASDTPKVSDSKKGPTSTPSPRRFAQLKKR
ncbi:regulator of Vps4 activity in the MVB pathway-domain-containing protein [Pholiota molesta]|nr:regulator of Vps4 activity in the MVB pathway-domain-containing protein [Pholiota molesta]